MNRPETDDSGNFAGERAAELALEAAAWNPSSLVAATLDDIPVVDVERFFATGDADELERLGEQVRFIGENIGFHCLVGHGIDTDMFESIFAAAEGFLTSPDEIKGQVTIDDPGAAAPGTGWLPLGERRLPERAKGNLNEAVLFKQDRTLRLADNPWLPESVLPGFRAAVEAYAEQIERVALALLPIYAVALELSPDWFEAAFQSPFYRLRMTRYTDTTDADADQYGIAPHVDTTFFTLLAQSGPGLAIYSEQRKMGSSPESVGGCELGEMAKSMVQSDFGGSEGAKTVRFFEGEFQFAVQAFGNAGRYGATSAEVVEQELAVTA